MTGKDDEMFMTRSFNVTPKITEQHLIARSDKSVAYATNNRRLCSTFCTTEANYWQTRSIARPLCDSRASCFHTNHPTEPPPLTGASNAGGMGRNRDSEPISGFIACCRRCGRLDVINTVPTDRGKLWHLSLVVSGGVCWWRETTTKCLWQEASTLRQRQQNSIQLHAVMNL